MEAYKNLEARFSDVTALNQIQSFLNWDQSVLMPQDGVHQRARQMSVLAVKIHGLVTAPEVGDWLAKANRGELNDWQKANLDMIARLHKRATAVPEGLIRRKMVQASETETIWRAAKKESDFEKVRPALEELVELVREEAEVLSGTLGVTPYESLMDHYAPGMTVAEVEGVFDDLAAFLPGFLDKVLQTQQDTIPLPGNYNPVLQEQLCRRVAEALGFDFKKGRLDTSAHPFSMGIGDDVRVTTRYKEADFTDAMQGVAHEVGHGFYDRYTPKKWHHQPVGASQNMGMAIHESQSLSIDMQLGRARPYWEFFAPMVQEFLGDGGGAHTAENLWRHTTRVTRSLIRVESDEVTYPLHIILRMRLEKDMVAGKLAVKDLPEAWNAEMQKLIGTVPPNDAAGCLQDIHWYCGSFGYFPAYALGAIIAAQWVEKMEKDMPTVWSSVEQGDFGAFTGWLKDNVQSKACLYTPQDLILNVTGTRLSAAPYKAHLKKRYAGDGA
ncbi:MAG: carboxypeptidase M32 [Alphaproteobacteria bacterium]|nr:carboxypeptidase M32 [Alphaproteobacteria bacterium]